MRRALVLAAFLSGLSIVFLVAATATAAAATTAVISTATGRGPLVVLGMMILAAGIVLLRRPVVVSNP